MGFERIYDYVGSKVEWMGADLPWEGTDQVTGRIGDLVDAAVPTCSLQESAGQVRPRIGGWPFALVVNPTNVVMGLVRSEALAMGLDDCPIVAIMQEGPSTYRPDVAVKELADRLAATPQTHVIVTTLDGRLVGVADADRVRAAAESEG